MMKRNIQPYTLAFMSLLALTLLAFYMLTIIKEINTTQVRVDVVKNDITVNKMIRLTNISRSKYNIPALIANEKLTEAARKKAKTYV